MKTLELTQATPDVAHLLDQAREDDLAVRLPDGSEFLLVAVGEFDREVAQARANRRLMTLLDDRARQTAVALEEIKGHLGLD
jgi:hypothetical protein